MKDFAPATCVHSSSENASFKSLLNFASQLPNLVGLRQLLQNDAAFLLEFWRILPDCCLLLLVVLQSHSRLGVLLLKSIPILRHPLTVSLALPLLLLLAVVPLRRLEILSSIVVNLLLGLKGGILSGFRRVGAACLLGATRLLLALLGAIRLDGSLLNGGTLLGGAASRSLVLFGDRRGRLGGSRFRGCLAGLAARGGLAGGGGLASRCGFGGGGGLADGGGVAVGGGPAIGGGLGSDRG